MTRHRKLTKIEKIGFGAGDTAVNISLMSIALLLTFFYTDIFGLDLKQMAFLFLIVRLIDAVTDPLMGWITDRVNSRYGRYRPWIGLAAIPFGISVYLVFANPDIPHEQKIVWAYATYIFNTIMFTVVTIPYISLIGVITDSPEERLSANAYRFVMAKMAVLFITTFLTALATWFGNGDKAEGFGAAMAIMAITSSIALLFCFTTTTERVEAPINKSPVKEQIFLLFKNDQWATLATASVFMIIGFVIRGSIAFHYATYYLLIDGGVWFAVFMSMWAIGGITATFFSAWLTARFCKVKIFEYSMFSAAAVAAVMFFSVGQGDIALGIFFYFLVCFMSEINTPIFWASITEVIDYGEHKSGKRVSGLTFGSFSFLQKFGMGVAGFAVGQMLAYLGYLPGVEQSETTLTGMSLMISVIPGAFFLATGIVMRRYIISNEYYKANLASLREPKSTL